MPNPENIVPYQFKPGQSGNPNGRPKNSRNVKNVMREFLETELLRRNPLINKKEKRAVIELLCLELLKKGLKGDLHAIREIFDRSEAPEILAALDVSLEDRRANYLAEMESLESQS